MMGNERLQYAPGDRVLIRRDMRYDERFWGIGHRHYVAWTAAKDKRLSQIGYVATIRNGDSEGFYKLEESSDVAWYFTEEMFEGLESEQAPDIDPNALNEILLL